MKKVLSLLLTIVLLASLFVSCGSQQTPTEGNNSAEGSAEKFSVRIIINSTNGEFPMMIANAFEAIAKDDDSIDYSVLNPEGDINNQIALIDQCIVDKVDLICLMPIDADALVDSVKNVNNAGIPLVEWGSTTNGGEYTFVGSDDFDAGKMMGDWLAEQLPENAKVCMLLGTPGQSATVKRSEGIQAGLFDVRGDVELLAEQSGNWSREGGMKIMEDWLQIYDQIDAVISHNDEMILGAVEAIKGSGRENIITTGVDAIQDACVAIRDGSMTMSIFQDGVSQGEKLYEVCKLVQNGTELENEYLIPYIVVTESNVDTFKNK